MSIFEHRKPARGQSHRSTLLRLHDTLERLEAERKQRPRIMSLTRIVRERVRELESEPASYQIDESIFEDFRPV